MGKRSRRERRTIVAGQDGDAPNPSRQKRRLITMAGVAVAAAIGVVLLVRSRGGADGAGAASFTRVGRNGPVFTIAVPRARVADDRYLLRVAEQL